MHTNTNLQELMIRLDYQFKNPFLLKEALTHPSVLANNPNIRSYQRLEFMGDAVINLFITEELFQRFPDASEGSLTEFKAYLASNEKLSEIAKMVRLSQFVVLSKSEESQGRRTDKYVLACVLEAISGAMFIDSAGGYIAVRKILKKYLLADRWFQTLTQRKLADFDSKSTLQEIAQSKLNLTPSYRVIDVGDSQHELQYTIEAMLGETQIGTGKGLSKKEAEKSAARDALEKTHHLSQNLPFGALRARAILKDILPEKKDGVDHGASLGSKKISPAVGYRRGKKSGFRFSRELLYGLK